MEKERVEKEKATRVVKMDVLVRAKERGKAVVRARVTVMGKVRAQLQRFLLQMQLQMQLQISVHSK